MSRPTYRKLKRCIGCNLEFQWHPELLINFQDIFFVCKSCGYCHSPSTKIPGSWYCGKSLGTILSLRKESNEEIT